MTRDEMLHRLREIDPAPSPDLEARQRARARLEELIEHDASSRPRRSRRRTRVVGALASVGVLGALIALLVLLVPAGGPSTPANEVGILERTPQQPADRLPAWVADSPRTSGIDPSTSRLAFTRGRRSFYVARGSAFREPTICLVDAVTGGRAAARRTGNPGGFNCEPASIMDEQFIVATLGYEGEGADRRAGLAGVAPDGFDRVVVGDRSAPITDNVFYVTETQPWEPIAIEGPAGRRVYHLGVVRPAAAPSPGGAQRLPVSTLSGDVPTGGIVVHRDAQGSYRLSLRNGRPFLTERNAEGRQRAATALTWPTDARPIGLMYGGVYRRGGGPATVSIHALVPDGYTRAELGGVSDTIDRNFVLMRDVTVELPSELVISGPGQITRSATVAPIGASQYRTQINP